MKPPECFRLPFKPSFKTPLLWRVYGKTTAPEGAQTAEPASCAVELTEGENISPDEREQSKIMTTDKVRSSTIVYIRFWKYLIAGNFRRLRYKQK